MKTLREYLERNNYSIVKSLAEMLAISPEEATDFYNSISTFDEGKVVDALKDDASEDEKSFVTDLFNKFQQTEVNEADAEIDPTFDDVNDRYEISHNGKEYTITDHKTGEIVDKAWSGHEAHNLLYYWRNQGKKGVKEAKKSPNEISKMAGKAQVGGYDPARELSKGQYQHRVIPNKAKKFDRAGQKAQLKRGMYENTVVPVLVNDDGYKFKIVESSLVADMKNVEAIFESAIVVSPIGGLTAVPGVGMNSLRKMAGIGQVDLPSNEPEITEIESPDVNDILSIISQMDDDSKACLINMLAQAEMQPETQIDAEQLARVKEALCSFGSALQSWIEEANGGLDFLCPLVDSLWVKYNEC